MKKIIITGEGSYIGMSVEAWLNRPQFNGMYQVDTVDMRGAAWREKDFTGYDAVLHVAGIAHADTGRVTTKEKSRYYQVNCDLAFETARKAKREGVRQFLYMSSIIVYGEGGSVRRKRVITPETEPSPSNFYGDSKWRAEKRLASLKDDHFHIAIIRPPMIYGEGCRGNYRTLETIAKLSPLFPDFPNQRSVLYIGNFCEFARTLMESGEGGVFFPQDDEYVKTADLIRRIAEVQGKKIYFTRAFNRLIPILGYCPGRIGRMANKAFGSLVYQKVEKGGS